MAKRTGAKPSGGKRGSYVPDAGDLVGLSFSPQAGREQAGRRPALVLSARFSNAKAGLCIVCPVTSQVKGYPFEVALPDGVGATGVVLADWRARRARHAGRLPREVVAEVMAKSRALLE